jgi:hypothetical protein
MRLSGMKIGMVSSQRRSVVSTSGPAWDYLVTNDAELASAITSATNGQIIALADAGTFTAQANLNGKTGVTLRGQTYGVPHLTAGLTATTTTNCKVLGLQITRTAPNNTSNYKTGGVVEITDSTGIEIAYCTVRSNTLSTITMQDGSSGSLYFQGYRGINGTNVASFNLHHNDVGECYRGHSIAAAAGTTGYIENNTGGNFYQNPCETSGGTGATIYIRHNSWIGIWAKAASDSGAPHSSVMGFSAAAAWTAIVIGNILISAPQRRFAAFGSYADGSGPKFNDTTSPTNAMHYTNCVFGWNICAVEDSIGLEMSLGNFNVFYNTIVKDQTSGTASLPSMVYHDVGANSSCAKNIFLTQGVGSHAATEGGPNGINADWYTNSWDNIVMRPNGLGGTVTGDINCYDFHFTGPTFTGLDTTNIVAAFTPLAGSYFTSDGIGAIGTGYDWNARSYSSLPTLTKPKTTNASGTTPALTQFDGTNDWLQMNVTAPFLDMANRRTLTQAFYATADNADTLDRYYSESSTTDFTIRRLGSSSNNSVRFRFKNTAGTAICEITSSGSNTGFTAGFGQRSADGSDVAKRLWVFTINLTTGRYFIMRGKEIDPFPQVSILKSDDYANTRTAQAIMGQSDTSPPTGTGLMQGRLGLFLMTDEFVNLSTAANHNNIVATDGTPADWGSNGSNFTGTQPRGFVKGNAAALNDAGGINLGSSPDEWVMTGAVVDA